MPTIELVLPGVRRKTVIDFADVYTITVERNDGIACSEVEAKTALSVFSIPSAPVKNKRKTTRTEKADLNAADAISP